MKLLTFSLITAFLLVSGCKTNKTQLAELLRSVDTIKLINYQPGIYETKVVSRRGIIIFTDLINLKQENLLYSKLIRDIEYYSKGKLILKASEIKEGIYYTFNGEKYSESISEDATNYNADPFLIKHQDFTPTANNNLEPRIYNLNLERVMISCACAHWAPLEDIRKREKHESDSSDIYMFIEPANPDLELPDTLAYGSDIIQFTGQFYMKKTYPKGYDAAEEPVEKARVFRYTKYKVLHSNYREAVSEYIKSKNNFDQDSSFEIISSYRAITKESSATDTNMCNGWTISRKHLNRVIKHTRLISGMEWHDYFDVLPCIVKGQLKQKGDIYNFEVNGGSWLFLKSKDTTIILGNYDPDDRKYFIEGPMKD